MTVGVVLRVPGQGAVLACDSRSCDDETGAIFSDTDQKFGEFGSVVACYAGCIGGVWVGFKDSAPRNWAELLKRATDLDADAHKVDYEILAYDRTKDRIMHADHTGDALHVPSHAAIGCGGPIALGVLDSVKFPSTLEAAAKLARKAVRIACKRNVFCGGRVRVVIVRGRKGVVDTR